MKSQMIKVASAVLIAVGMTLLIGTVGALDLGTISMIQTAIQLVGGLLITATGGVVLWVYEGR